jgi:hypothetical protein
MASDVRILQVARILDLSLPGLTPDDVRAAVALRPGELARALFFEAADNDDVTSTGAALDYFESRLGELGDLVPPEAVDEVRGAFRQQLEAWE